MGQLAVPLKALDPPLYRQRPLGHKDQYQLLGLLKHDRKLEIHAQIWGQNSNGAIKFYEPK